MKINAPAPIRQVWHVLTEVPGWPDAPVGVRLRRFLPILVPGVLACALLAWRGGVRDPQIDAIRAGFAPYIELESQVAQARLSYSEQEAQALSESADAAKRKILHSPAMTAAVLASLREECLGLGWEGTFQAYDPPADAMPAETPVVFVPVSAKLAPRLGAQGAFSNLIKITERLFAHDIRVDLTRLQVKAGDAGLPGVEMNLRLALLNTDEKAAQ